MKMMTCRQLAGACDLEFRAETFEEMAILSQQHGKEMLEQNDEAHLEAMQKMREVMSDTTAMQTWMDAKRKEFDALANQ